jgi:hypothetical protein
MDSFLVVLAFVFLHAVRLASLSPLSGVSCHFRRAVLVPRCVSSPLLAAVCPPAPVPAVVAAALPHAITLCRTALRPHARSILLAELSHSRYDTVSSVDEFKHFAHRGKSFAQWKLHVGAANTDKQQRRGQEEKMD